MKVAHGIVAVLGFMLASSVFAAEGTGPYAVWKFGPSSDPSYFPLAVWMQSPTYAQQYSKAGINVYVALSGRSLDTAVDTLRAAGIRVVISQSQRTLQYINDPIVLAWMHGDEPDNAQSLAQGNGYGPPIAPEKIISDYERIRTADPSRPVLLNLGQGVAWDGWYGRGVRTNHPEDYLEYIKGGDIVSFDIYPVATADSAVHGNLSYVPLGVGRLHTWGGGKKIVWNCIETTGINSGVRPTPAQVRSEVWLSIIKGSQGIIYFCHEWKPVVSDHALLNDPEMLAGVTALNAQIKQLAPVINSPDVEGLVGITSSNAAAPVEAAAKRYNGSIYLFSAGMKAGKTHAAFNVKGATGTVEVIGENRKIPLTQGRFEDDFDSYGVHLYRIGK
jgi:hypothetical protein